MDTRPEPTKKLEFAVDRHAGSPREDQIDYRAALTIAWDKAKELGYERVEMVKETISEFQFVLFTQ